MRFSTPLCYNAYSMTLWLFVSGILAPAIFWIGYFYYKDRFQPEPMKSLGLAYIFGFLTAIACIRIYGFLPLIGLPYDPSPLMQADDWRFLLYCLGVVGFLEELFKFLPFLFILKLFKQFDEPADGIIYASIIALGFASFENFHHLAYLSGFELFGRALAAPLVHTIFASIWGYMAGIAYLARKNLFLASVLGIGIAAILHGLYDFLTTSTSSRLLAAFLILVVWIWRIGTLEKLGAQTKSGKQ